jgi:hypothetical protein
MMKYKIKCKKWLQVRIIEDSEEMAIYEAERLSNFHGASFEVIDEKGFKIGETYIPDPIYVFQKD